MRVFKSYLVLVIILATKTAKLVKLAKVAKPALTFGSMSLSAVAYAFWLGPWLAISLVLLLLVHELGHVIAMRLRGYPASAPVFIPFLGAAIFMPPPRDREDEAIIGIGGPLLGGGIAAALGLVWLTLPPGAAADIVLVSSYLGLFLNLFNLLPIRPLDGGRITQAVGEWFIYIGVGSLLVLTLTLKEPVLLLIWLICLPDLPWLSAWVKAALIGPTLQFGMITLMFAGYSSQPFWVDVFDAFLGFFVLAQLIHMARGWISFEPVTTQPPLPMSARLRWLASYIALALALTVMMGWQFPLLPHEGR